MGCADFRAGFLANQGGEIRRLPKGKQG